MQCVHGLEVPYREMTSLPEGRDGPVRRIAELTLFFVLCGLEWLKRASGLGKLSDPGAQAARLER